MRAPSSWPSHHPKAPPLKNVTSGIKISTYKIWGGTQTFRPRQIKGSNYTHVKSSGCVPFVFYAVLFPSILLSFISSQQHLSVSTIKKESKYYRKSLQYAWSFTLLPKNGEMKIFSSMFHKWTSKTASKKKLRLVNYSSILRRELEIQLYLQYHPGKSY